MIAPLHYHDTETTQSVSLGKVYRQDSTGRTWRYSENGGTQADPGKLMSQAVQTANHVNMSFASAAAIGADQATVTLGATAATANDYKDGWLVVQDGTGEGIAYNIEGHPAADASASLTLDLKEDIVVAVTTAETNADLAKNLYKDVVISSTDQADVPVGVFNKVIAADAYGMIQTWGPCAVWQDEASAIGSMLVTGTGVAGQVEAQDASGEPVVGIIGPQTGVIAEYQLVYLRLAA